MANVRSSVAGRLIDWQRQHGRNHLPWQSTQDPYRVWLSEIMLQQTQVSTVLGYYERFLARWPSVHELAHADIDEVLNAWAGLGYYARARNLHACAQQVVEKFGGAFPTDSATLATLPGIGQSTAAAIAAFCFGERAAILDGNVKRVLARQHAIQADPSKATTIQLLWQLARQQLPTESLTQRVPDAMARYTQALMDLGATVCTRQQPQCDRCPISKACQAHQTGLAEQLPLRRIARARPMRDMHLLWLSRDNQVLLERRPDRGIWGGLWCLPAFETESALQSWCEQTGIPISALRPMATLTHDLTHFRLMMTPWRAQGLWPVEPVDRPTARWMDSRELNGVGLPKPIGVLLSTDRFSGGDS